MISRFPFLPGGLALIATTCAMPQTGSRRTTPIEHTVLRGEQLHTDRQIVEEREIQLLTVFGNLAAMDNRPISVQLSSVLEAPVIDGTSLRITRLLQQDQILLVAYASPDGRPLGALALIDVTHPSAPQLRAELQLPSVAISAVAWDAGQIYFAGSNADGAVLGRISVQGFEWQDDLKIQALDLASASSLSLMGEQIWVLDRDQGLLVSLNKKDWLTRSQVSVPGLTQLEREARSLWTVRDNNILQLDGDLHVKASFSTGASTSAAPGPIRVGQETVMTARGAEGVRSFCQLDQRPLFFVPPVIRADLDPKRTQTRDAVLSQGLLVTANEEAGIYLYSVATEDQGESCKERILQLEGYLDLGKEFVAETLSWQGTVLSVGDGEGRLNLFYIDRERFETDDNDFDS